jgi:ATP-binding protein involved in chromosome partitioning
MISKEMVLERLSHVKGPDLKGDIVSQKLVSDIVITGGKVVFSINVPAERAAELEPLREAAEKSVSLLEGVSQVTAVLTAERRSAAAPHARSAVRQRARSTTCRCRPCAAKARPQ